MQNTATPIMIEITPQPLEPTQGINFCHSPSCGAESIFIGSVRNQHHGQIVSAIEYEVEEAMTKTIMHSICQEAAKEFGTQSHYVAHRTGLVNSGDISILIIVSSPHRKAAIHACEYILEAIKHRAPIWKHEYFANGNDEWVLSHVIEYNKNDDPKDLKLVDTASS